MRGRYPRLPLEGRHATGPAKPEQERVGVTVFALARLRSRDPHPQFLPSRGREVVTLAVLARLQDALCAPGGVRCQNAGNPSSSVRQLRAAEGGTGDPAARKSLRAADSHGPADNARLWFPGPAPPPRNDGKGQGLRSPPAIRYSPFALQLAPLNRASRCPWKGSRSPPCRRPRVCGASRRWRCNGGNARARASAACPRLWR